MKCFTPEISWHNKDPVLSVDLQPNTGDGTLRLASGGSDSIVLIWHVLTTEYGDEPKLEVASELSRHQRGVNCVRWSPSGELLASCDDESFIFIWKQKGNDETLNILENVNEQNKEIWLIMKTLRGHLQDVYDLSWSPDSSGLVSGSIDNTAIIWDVPKAKTQAILNDHNGFVQGVAWDPKNSIITTLSSDRYFRAYNPTTKKLLSRISKIEINKEDKSQKPLHLYHDDTLQTFFRRLCFSPDGELIVTPCGINDNLADEESYKYSTYVYSKHCLKRPALVLPCPNEITTAVRFSPILYELRPHKKEMPPAIQLPYRMIFAIATKTSVYLYDTQQTIPFGIITNIHYTRLTDLTWSYDGSLLMISSTDGFCTFITFSHNELGVPYKGTVDKENIVLQQNNNNINKSNEILSNKSNISLTVNTIAIKRKPKPEQPEKTNVNVTPPKPTIIIPNEIISISEKFETPEKVDSPATPIQIRREPRSQHSTESLKLNLDKGKDSTAKTPTQNVLSKTPGSKSRTPSTIPIRRHPRILNAESKPQASVTIAIDNDDDETDVWPIGEPRPKTDFSNIIKKSNSNPTPMDVDDISDGKEEEVSSKICPVTPKSKTPRRVELITISTPKSKKK